METVNATLNIRLTGPEILEGIKIQSRTQKSPHPNIEMEDDSVSEGDDNDESDGEGEGDGESDYEGDGEGEGGDDSPLPVPCHEHECVDGDVCCDIDQVLHAAAPEQTEGPVPAPEHKQ